MISIVFHLFVVLGISFVMPNQIAQTGFSPPLKITLVTRVSDSAPDQIDTLAQANSAGEQGVSAELPDLVASIKQIPESRPAVKQTDNIISRESATARLSDHQAAPDSALTRNDLSREQIARSISLANLNARSKPREKYISARSRESTYAVYIEKWRRLVERVGNLNYPEEARLQKLQGSLVLDVAISADGAVSKIRVLSSSGYKTLDDAAARIVLMAAPFAPFPDTIKTEIDILHIVRTWEFGQGRLKSTAAKPKTAG